MLRQNGDRLLLIRYLLDVAVERPALRVRVCRLNYNVKSYMAAEARCSLDEVSLLEPHHLTLTAQQWVEILENDCAGRHGIIL